MLCVAENCPSVAVTTAEYVVFVSKSGAEAKLNTPSVVIDSSDPEIVYVTASPLPSIA